MWSKMSSRRHMLFRMIPFEAVRREGEQVEVSEAHPPRLMRYISSQIAEMRRELRMGLPVLTREDLRRYRMYEAESVLLELLSGGADWAGQVLWQLLHLDKQSRAAAAQDLRAARVLRRPALTNCPELLHALAVGLTEADAAIKRGEPGAAGAQLLVLAEMAWSRGLSWWWLTERLLELAAEQSRGSKHDGGLCEASVALARGAFLLHQLNECGESLEHLTRAAQLAAGKPWRAAASLLQLQEDVEQGLFQVASRALAEALVQEARAARKQADHGRSTALCREAVQRAQDARAVELELGAQRELGVCLLAAGQPQEAVAAFRVFLSLAQAADSPRDVVTAHLKLALCFHSQGDSDSALRSLREARGAAEELGQPDLLAKAHTFLGELFLNTSQPRYATAHLHAACALSGLRSERDRARALAGVAGGLELLQPLVAAIGQSGPGQPERRSWLLKLLAWKDRHQPFWPEDSVVSNAIKSLYTPHLRSHGEDNVGIESAKDLEAAPREGEDLTVKVDEKQVTDVDEYGEYDHGLYDRNTASRSTSKGNEDDEFIEVVDEQNHTLGNEGRSEVSRLSEFKRD